MAEFVNSTTLSPLPEGAARATMSAVERLKASTKGEKVAALRSDLQAEMMDKASVFRTDESLNEVQSKIAEFRARYRNVTIDDKGSVFNYDVTEALELGYLIDLAECLVVSAKARTESRGAHFRDDFPTRDDGEWMKHTLAFLEGAGSDAGSDGTRVRLDYKPVIAGAYQPMERKY